MCHVASLAVTYIGLGIIQLNALLPDGLCVGLGNEIISQLYPIEEFKSRY